MPEAPISGMDKEIIPVCGTRLQHQSPNKAIIVTDVLAYWALIQYKDDILPV